MKTKLNLYILLTTCILFIAGCDDANTPTPPIPSLPPATQTGANIFGCMVDTALAKTTSAYSQLYGKGVEYYLGTDSVLTIKAITDEPRRDFYFKVDLKGGILGIHTANQSAGFGFSSLNNAGGNAPIGSNYYTINDSLPATMIITKYDGQNPLGATKGNIISGTFDFVMVNNAGYKIHLTSGRFDIAKL
jgi:hypothetical protein